MICPVCQDENEVILYAPCCHHGVCKTCIPRIAESPYTYCVQNSSVIGGILYIKSNYAHVSYTCPICRNLSRCSGSLSFHPLPQQDVPEFSELGNKIMKTTDNTMKVMSEQFKALEETWARFPALVSEVDAKIKEKNDVEREIRDLRSKQHSELESLKQQLQDKADRAKREAELDIQRRISLHNAKAREEINIESSRIADKKIEEFINKWKIEQKESRRIVESNIEDERRRVIQKAEDYVQKTKSKIDNQLQEFDSNLGEYKEFIKFKKFSNSN